MKGQVMVTAMEKEGKEGPETCKLRVHYHAGGWVRERKESEMTSRFHAWVRECMLRL